MVKGYLLSATVALAAAGLSVPAGATPATSCSFTVRPPTVLAMRPGTQSVPTTVSANCPAAASYSLSVDFAGSDSYNSNTGYGPLHYDQTNQAAAFQFTSCRSADSGNNGHYAANLVSATVED